VFEIILIRWQVQFLRDFVNCQSPASIFCLVASIVPALARVQEVEQPPLEATCLVSSDATVEMQTHLFEDGG
jgi:hypothetical protein